MSDIEPDTEARRREIAGKARVAASDTIGDLWWVFFMRGAVALALGIAALFWPTGSISLLLRVAGLVLVLDGAMTFFGMRRQAGQGAASASGLGSALVGAVLVLLPSVSARLAFVLLGIWGLIIGVGYLMTWWQMPETDPERGTARNVGAVAVLIGIALIFWPATGLVALGWIIAIVALVISALMFFLASRLKRLSARIRQNA